MEANDYRFPTFLKPSSFVFNCKKETFMSFEKL